MLGAWRGSEWVCFGGIGCSQWLVVNPVGGFPSMVSQFLPGPSASMFLYGIYRMGPVRRYLRATITLNTLAVIFL